MKESRLKRLEVLEQKLSLLNNEVDNEYLHNPKDFINEDTVLAIIKVLEDAGIDCFKMFANFTESNERKYQKD